MKLIKTVEEAFKKQGVDLASIPTFDGFPEIHKKALIAHAKLIIVRGALVGDYVAKWNDGSWKYYPWFEVTTTDENPAGVGLSYFAYGCGASATGVGSRLCFPTEAMAKYAGTQFKELYEDYFLTNKNA